MDQASRSSEPPRDRAVSAEPCSTRPNPFDDGDFSRKRRRTSLSGSRSLSTDAERSPSAQDDPSTSATLVDSLPEAHTGMSMDTDPSTPQTPEREPPADDACPSERASSRVTLNLRQPNPSSPGSPTPHNLGNADLPDSLVGGDVKPSVEDPGDDVRDSDVTLDGPDAPAPAAAATPASSLSGSPSPPDIQVIDIPDEEDDDLLGDDEPEVSIIGEQRNPLYDPTPDFAYNETELQLDTVNRLSNYLSNDPPLDETVIESLHIWIDAFIRWAELVGYPAAYASCVKHSELWRALPELMWAIGNRNHLRMAMSHPIISTFCLAFARLTSFFVTLDIQTLTNVIQEETPVLDKNGLPEVFSFAYLASLHHLVRREEPRILNDLDDQSAWPRTDTISVLIHRFQQFPGLSLQNLTKLVNAQIELMDRFPKFVDHPAAACQVVADVVWEAERRMHFIGATPQIVEQSTQFLFRGHRFYLVVSQALSRNIDKLVNHLTQDGASGQIISLTDIYHCALRGDHELATEVLSAHKTAHPELPAQGGPGAIAWEWRFNMFARLIMSGQMTLRVWAVSSMCSDLVMFWKRWGEQRDEVVPFLRYFAQYLMRTKLVEYILGPSCHPEITAESGNVVGFLLVTKYYRKEHTDLLWKTITTTQDPRVADALTRMTANIAPLCDQKNLLYICEKLLSLPIDAFATPSVRHLCEQVFKQLVLKFHAERTMMSFLPYELCLRLLRESSVPSAGPQAQVAYPDIHVFATQKLRELHLHGPDVDGRRRIYLTCIQDIAAKSPTALGSLGGLYISIRHSLSVELRVLCADHDLPRLVIEELEHAISASRSASGQPVLVGSSNLPRRDFITSLICHAPDTLAGELGKRLWDLLVGPNAACEDDWDPAWQVLEEATRQASWNNSFISTCLSTYYPTLPSRCLCMGALRFLKLGILPRVAGSEIALDNDESVRDSGIGELWRIVLTAPDQQVADCAIDVLVKDIHIDSAAILSYPHHRARQVHLKLVTRCLEQLGEAAQKILASSEGTTSGDDEPMVIVETETEMLEQERMFIRSLALLRLFLQAHRSKAHFATADIRPLMPPSPTAVEGESAELKFQSFDGDTQTDVRPLNIGRQNTAGSLLASLRDATGFENYRIYYKGQVFQINETEICKSLDDLHIRNGLILVKREEHGTSPSSRVKPGTSPLEIEILGHFDELWGYLSLEERFAQEIYQFLVKLPADSHILELIDSPVTPYQDVFPPGQPFKCLYAGYALAEYTEAARRQGRGAPLSATESAPPTSYKDSLERALMLLFSAIREPEIIDRCPNDDLKCQLSVQLMTGLVDLLIAYKEFVTSQQTDWAEVVPPSRRLLDIVRTAASAPENEYSLRLVSATYSAVLLLSVLSTGFWDALTQSETFGLVTQDLLLDGRPGVRAKINQTIKDACLNDHPLRVEMANFFWPWVSGVIPKLTGHPLSCHECFELTEFLMLVLLPQQSPVLDLAKLAKRCCSLLLSLTSSEDIGDAEPDDAVVGGLIRLLRCSTEIDKTTLDRSAKLFPSNAARALFWRYLFPLERADGEPIPSVLLNNTSRSRLYDIIFDMVKGNGEQFQYLLEDLKELVPYDVDEEGDPYHYDLPTQFERAKAIRSTCGYVGLRNLSNTCYLNSLFTQLFMNTDFRRFILGAGIGDSENQKLLFTTQKLFAYMQESIRRFVDPYMVVNSIKTYDDTEIDVHNQMDVDEFYNLLFDRWESQLLTADERKTLRSFYGGQLVQQVTSRECEHVSERLEPFSAIQCDIKGKATLQESLEAYVGGEVMEGDNKYKCSTCDKHVNAVKRACLKDLPDNLIFHLKRFDFNLRLMQRSKINDYFSFPTKIDMRPYTIEHLSNPTEAGPEDVFELVGILVHSGTAESGHYYSYIRERPSSGKGDTWVEFNDDLVTPWDPETMESSTFGGPDFRYDNNNIVYDKNYSAYMLFYQRSSKLQPGRESIPTPLKVSLPEHLLEHIRHENSFVLRRHCLYDPNHTEFVHRVVKSCIGQAGRACLSGHRMERLAMHVTLGHLDQVVSRTKDAPQFPEYNDLLNAALFKCADCAFNFFHYFSERSEAFRCLLQRNPEPLVRSEFGDLLITALAKIKEDLPHKYGTLETALSTNRAVGWVDTRDVVVAEVPYLFDVVWSGFHSNLRSWKEVFGTMVRFARLGDLETILLLDHDYLLKLVRLIQADPQLELSAIYHRMLSNVLRRAHNRPPNYEGIITLIDQMISVLHPVFTAHHIIEKAENRLLVYAHGDSTPPWTSLELLAIHQDWQSGDQGNIFVMKLLEINQAPEATEKIIERLVQAGREMEVKVYYTLLANISALQGHLNAPYLRAAVVFCRVADNNDLVLRVLTHVAGQSARLNNAEGQAFVEFHNCVYGVPEPDAEPDAWTAFFHLTRQIPKWAPHMLAYYDRTVRYQTEELLQKALFDYGTEPKFDDDEGGKRRSEVVVEAARDLGLKCLHYLRDQFVQRRVQVARDNLHSLHSMLARTSAYFQMEPELPGKDMEFAQLNQNVIEALEQITVDEIEEEGSEWDHSGISSTGDFETLDALGDDLS